MYRIFLAYIGFFPISWRAYFFFFLAVRSFYTPPRMQLFNDLNSLQDAKLWK